LERSRRWWRWLCWFTTLLMWMRRSKGALGVAWELTRLDSDKRILTRYCDVGGMLTSGI
jgi:hypothetical protein